MNFDTPELVSRRREYKRKWHLENRERILREKKIYWNKHKVRFAKRRQEWLKANPDYNKTYLKEYYRTNREQMLKQMAEHHALHPEVRRRWRDRNKDVVNAKMRAWCANNRDRIRSYRMRSEALRKKAGAINLKSIKLFVDYVKAKSTAVCYWCQKRVSTRNIHFDHIVALANGGPHSVDNLCVSCPCCNCSKRDTPVRAWVKVGQQILEL